MLRLILGRARTGKTGRVMRQIGRRAAAGQGGSVLLVSQFTLAGDARHGNRPSFSGAARPEEAEPLCAQVKADLEAAGLRVETGRFRTHMKVSLVNDGPVTILLDSRKDF